ncbi:MAG: hypothetical protein ABL966_11785 [Acidimicrobiales bacterium]
MASDEAAWLHLYERARSAFDDAAANELMNALERNPATRDDIVRLDARIDVLEANLWAEITAANSELLRTLFFGMIASNATLVGLVFAAVRLA